MTESNLKKIHVPQNEVPETFTGERYLPSIDGEIQWEHLHRYMVALQYCEDKDVLDIASGEGYGSNILSQVARSVIGVDIDKEAVETAQRRYPSPNLNFKVGSCEEIPCVDQSFNVVISFETIEHIRNQEGFLNEIKRVLKPNGVVVISTPEKTLYDDERKGGHNAFHLKELSLEEFHGLLSAHFKYVEIGKQSSLLGSVITGSDSSSQVKIFSKESPDTFSVGTELPAAPYAVVVCSDVPVAIQTSIFNPSLPSTIYSALMGGIKERDEKIMAGDVSARNLTDYIHQLEEAVDRAESSVEILKQNLQKESARSVTLHSSLIEEIKALEDSSRREREKAASLQRDWELTTTVDAEGTSKVSSIFNNVTQVLYPSQRARYMNITYKDVFEAVIQTILKKRDGSYDSRIHLHNEVDEILKSGLFDQPYYLRQVPSLSGSTIDPVIHYLTDGWKEGKNPNPLFDSSFYQTTNPDLHDAPVAPLLHYIRHGQAELRHPHPLFDPSYYLLNANLKGEKAPLLHYLTQGVKQNLNPHPLFLASFYMGQRNDVTGNPVIHYLHDEVDTAALPHPLFDASYYLKKNRDVSRSGIHPLVHYARYGHAECRHTSPHFDPEFYRSTNPDLPPTVDPIRHYFDHGASENRNCVKYFDRAFFLSWCPEALENPSGVYFHYLMNFALRDKIGCSEQSILTLQKRAIVGEEKAMGLTSKHSSVAPKISIVIPVYNQIDFTLRSISSILESNPKVSYEIIVVDDCSTDQSEHILTGLYSITYVRQKQNQGFIASCNAGAENARGEYVVFLNNDTHVLANWLDELYETFSNNPQAGLVGSKLIYPNGLLQEAGGIIWKDGSAWNYGKFSDRHLPEYNYVRSVDYCSGASLMIETKLFKELGGFDSHFAPAYCEDTDLALKVRAHGMEVLYQPFSMLVHFEGVSSGTDLTKGVKSYQVTNMKKLSKRWDDSFKRFRANGELPFVERNRDKSKRLLYIDACTPTPDQDAGSIVADTWLTIIKNLGYHVTFIPFDNLAYVPRYTEALQRRGIFCPHFPYMTSVKNYVQEYGTYYDVVVVNRYKVATEIYKYLDFFKINSIRRVFLPIDLHYVRELRKAELEGSESLRKQSFITKCDELRTAALSDCICVHSAFEKEELQSHLPTSRIEVSPIMMDVKGRKKAFEERNGIFFMGGFRHEPNVDAVFYFSRNILPLIHNVDPSITFNIIGTEIPAAVYSLESSTTKILGYIPDLTPVLAAARCTVAPLRFGAGVKGKVVMSMSHGVPVVCTPIAAEGMNLQDGSEVLIAASPDQFAASVLQVYNDKETWYRISDASIKRVEAEYSIQANTPLVENYIGDYSSHALKNAVNG